MNSYKMISDQELNAIHQATLQVLAEVGIILTHPPTQKMMGDAGAIVKDNRVYFPAKLVDDILAISGGEVKIRGRNGESITLGNGKTHWHNVGGVPRIYHPETGKPRFATVKDVIQSTRLLDFLEHATTITPFFTPTDVPGELMSLAMYRHAIPNTTKPLQGPGVQVAAEVEFTVRMAEVIGKVDEVLTMSVSPVSPLTFPTDMVESMVEIARYGIPFGPLPCPTAGTTAPLSLAGALTQQNAEVLASIILVKLINPEISVIYCGRLTMMEPRTGISVWGGVELGVASAATVQLGHRYNMPVNVYGLSTNAHVFDVQNGYERAMNALIPALAGADELSGIGEMEAGVMGSFAQMVIDNEIVGSVNRAVKGFEVTQDSLAAEVIKSVMDGPKSFMAEKHTISYLRAGEIFSGKLGERRSFEVWDRNGREGMAERAQAEAERILETHQVPPLATEQERELDKIMQAAEKELIKQ
jgi:trimethylamine--corrinoid protein Co-methyltransferase